LTRYFLKKYRLRFFLEKSRQSFLFHKIIMVASDPFQPEGTI